MFKPQTNMSPTKNTNTPAKASAKVVR